MFGKIIINGTIEVVTGLHIGTGGEFSAIGAVDSPVVRDPVSQLPIITGSTLKGKLRSVLARKYSGAASSANDDTEQIKRLFGSMSKASRIIFSDMPLCNMDELNKLNIYNPTEVKYENTINRLTGVANPRQIERVIRGSKFALELVYNVDDDMSAEEAEEDISLLAEGMKLLQYDYIGGHGSRGYGKIKFTGLNAQDVVGEIDQALIGKINDILSEAD